MAMGYVTGTSMVTPSTTPNMSLPLSMSRPIDVDANTPNLEEVQGFPVVRVGGGFHFHQDPISGQMYRMSDDFHGQIPQILASRPMMSTTMTAVGGGMGETQTTINLDQNNLTNQNFYKTTMSDQSNNKNFDYFGEAIPINTNVFFDTLNENRLLYNYDSYYVKSVLSTNVENKSSHGYYNISNPEHQISIENRLNNIPLNKFGWVESISSRTSYKSNRVVNIPLNTLGVIRIVSSRTSYTSDRVINIQLNKFA